MDYERMISPHLRELRTYCDSICGSMHGERDDLVQETLIRTYLYVLRHNRIENMRSFLFRTARNVWIDDYRHRRSRITVTDTFYGSKGQDSSYVEVRGVLEQAAEKVSLRNLRLLLLSDYFGYSMQEIAALTRSTLPAVKCALHRARRQVRGSMTAVKRSGLSEKQRQEVERWTQQILYGT